MSRDTENGRENEAVDMGVLSCLHYREMETGTKILPTVMLRGLSILPGMVIHFDLSTDKSIEAVEQAMLADQRIFVVTQKSRDSKMSMRPVRSL